MLKMLYVYGAVIMRVRRGSVVLGSILVLGLSLPARTAGAHDSGTHDRVVQVEPAVVHIETSATVRVVLHDMHRPVFLQQKTYTVPTLSAGTGVTVNPTGTIVTASSVVRPDLATAQIYAANKMFADYYHIPVPGDPLVKHRLPDATNDQKLQQCYETDELYMNGPNCVVFVTSQVRVFPFVTKPTATGVTAELLPGKPGDPVAVLSVNGTNLPSATISTSNQPVTDVSTVGFLGPPTAATTPATADEHLSPPGAGRFTAADLGLVRKGLGTQTAGVPVVNAANGSVLALLDGNPTAPTLIPAEKISGALQSLGISARPSLVDSVFAEANAFFGHAQYRNAVPRLREVLRLDPDHALATQMLRTAEKASGTAADTSNTGNTATEPVRVASKGSSISGWVILLLVILALLGIAFALALRFGSRLPGIGAISRRLPTRTEPGADSAAGARLEGAGRRESASRPQTSEPESPGLARRVLDLTVRRPRTPLDDPSAERTPDARRDRQSASTGAQRVSAGQHRGTRSATLTGQQYCTQCGSRVSSQYRFCSSCGSETD
jgi:hypothetical protein